MMRKSEQSLCIVAMEACATSHFWGRFAQGCGHAVRVIPPIYVKPFVKRQRNDAADAAAIAVAALRPKMHNVAVKGAEHQARAVAFQTNEQLTTLPALETHYRPPRSLNVPSALQDLAGTC
jgi:transposase